MELHSGEQLLEMMHAYQVSCILAAAVDLDIFGPLQQARLSASEVATATHSDQRGITILLDALAAVGVLTKDEGMYGLPQQLEPYLCKNTAESIIPMLHHQGVCLRRWAHLPWTVRSGVPSEIPPSLQGEEADQEAFIQAMHVVSRDVAPRLIPEINPSGFQCVLDLGGASGSWTQAWLEAEPGVRAIIFDLPHVIPMARARLSESQVADRVDYVAGDFYQDALPPGADLVWVSAIIHQNSRQQNLDLFRRIADTIEPNGWIYIRDIVLEADRTAPVAGALFAVNMLSATPGGNSYSFNEIEADLIQSGFTDVELVRKISGCSRWCERELRSSVNGALSHDIPVKHIPVPSAPVVSCQFSMTHFVDRKMTDRKMALLRGPSGDVALAAHCYAITQVTGAFPKTVAESRSVI